MGNGANLSASTRQNLYNRAGSRERLANPTVARQNLKQARPTPGRANDVYADRNGNLARRTDSGWQTRETGGWQEAARDRDLQRPTPATRDRSFDGPSTKQPASRPSSFDRSGFDRAHMARSRGMQRTNARPSFAGGGLRGRR